MSDKIDQRGEGDMEEPVSLFAKPTFENLYDNKRHDTPYNVKAYYAPPAPGAKPKKKKPDNKKAMKYLSKEKQDKLPKQPVQWSGDRKRLRLCQYSSCEMVIDTAKMETDPRTFPPPEFPKGKTAVEGELLAAQARKWCCRACTKTKTRNLQKVLQDNMYNDLAVCQSNKCCNLFPPREDSRNLFCSKDCLRNFLLQQ